MLTGATAALAVAVGGLGGAIPLGVAFMAKPGHARAAMLVLTVVVVAFAAGSAVLALVNPTVRLAGDLVAWAAVLVAISTRASWPIGLRR